ncbi:MAG TPA: hypothetical protein VFQ38_15390 [Longimicrobiales bacterium]|nr:hypothetical protein [Longimicrobiales bacterium]
MRALILAAMAALLVTAVAPSMTSAQQPAPTPAPTAKQPVQFTLASFNAALPNTAANIAKAEGLKELTADRVKLVSLADLVKQENVKSVNLEMRSENVQALQSYLTSSRPNAATIRQALSTEALKLSPSDVVAIDVLDTGDTVLYYQPPKQ